MQLIDKKIVFSLFLVSFFIVLISLPIVIYGLPERNPREILLDFYTQETVAHGAMFFAASAAAFTFITRLVEKVKDTKKSIIFMFFSGILLMLVIFLGFRIVYYGSLSNTIILDNKIYPENLTLHDYALKVNENIMQRNSTANLIDNIRFNLVKAANQGIINFRPFAILPVSVYLGFFFSYLIYFGFAGSSSNWKLWFSFFILPVFLGLLGASYGLSDKIGYELTIIFLIYYTVIPLARALPNLTSSAEGMKWSRRFIKVLFILLFFCGVILIGLIWIDIFSRFFGFSNWLLISMSVGSILFMIGFLYTFITHLGSQS